MKHKIRSTKYEASGEIRNQKFETKPTRAKKYDLEERTLAFAKQVRALVRVLPRNIANNEDAKQLARSSGSIGANYREANDSLSKKDFAMRIKIARKEAKETIYWLELLEVSSEAQETARRELEGEATELMKILGAILRSSE